MTKEVFLLVVWLAWLPAAVAELSLHSASGRTVLQRGETFDVALSARLPAAADAAAVEFWWEEGGRRVRLGSEKLGPQPAGPFAAAYRIDSGPLRVGAGQLVAKLTATGTAETAVLALEIADANRATDFQIAHMGLPKWVLPTGHLLADSRRYHFNFMEHNVGDSWHRGGAGVELAGPEKLAEDHLRYGIDFMKWPTGYGWGLSHRPLRRGASWYDPTIIDLSAQLIRYYAQAVRRFPSAKGLNPIDEPSVAWTDEWMAQAFQERTGLEAPAENDRSDLDRFVAYQTFRNHVLNDFNQVMKRHMLAVAPRLQYSLETHGDIVTAAGLYNSGNTFLDVQHTHMYDHWPTSNNWILFGVNLRRANRPVFWHMPLIVFTGCFSIFPDQWRAAWSLGMSEKLDGHGFFLGAGEIPEDMPWGEFNLAELIRINRRCERYGNFFLALSKPVEPVALWYSLAQAGAATPERGYEQQVVGAFYALKRAHVPVTVVTDEDLRAGLLAEHQALLLVDLDYVPADLRRAVEQFQAKGGQLIADRVTRAAFKNVIPMDVDFREFAAAIAESGRALTEKRMATGYRLRRDLLAETGILRDLPRVEAAFAPLVKRAVDAASPHTMLAVQRRGEASYVFVANEASVVRHPNRHWEDPDVKVPANAITMRWINLQESVPAQDTLWLPLAANRVVYDLWTGERLRPDKLGAVRLWLPPAGLRVLCVFPAEVREPTLSVSRKDDRLEIVATPARGNSGVVPAALEVRDEDGRVVLRKFVALDLADAAKNRWSYPLAVNDRPGTWRVEFRNQLTGKITVDELKVAVTPRRAIVSRLAPVAVLDGAACQALAGRKNLVVVGGTGCEAQARRIADALQADLKKPEEIRARDVLPDYLDPDKIRGTVRGGVMPRWEPLDLTVGDVDVVLVGTPENNLLLKDINQSGLLTRVVNEATLGAGAGLVEYCWSPFDPGKDAVLVAGYDTPGLEAACDRFLALAAGQDNAPPPQALAAEWAIEGKAAGPPAEPAVKPIELAWRTKVGDGIRKLAAGGGLVAVGGMDSRLSVFDGDGRLLWSREFDYRVIGVAVSPDGQRVMAAAYPRVYVFDRTGRLLFLREQPEPSLDDVEGLAARTGEAAGAPAFLLGTWTGKVTALDATGKRLWEFARPAPEKPEENLPETRAVRVRTLAAPPAGKPAPTSPEPVQPLWAVRTIVPLPDGGAAVASIEELVLLDKDGKQTAAVGVPRLQDACLAGERIVAASFGKQLYLVDRQCQLVWSRPTEDFIMAADATPDGRRIAAALFGGEVVVFDAAGGLVRRGRVPFETTLTGIALDPAGGQAWLSTWDGEVLCWKWQ